MNNVYLDKIKTRVCHSSNKNIRPLRTANLNKFIQKNIVDVIITKWRDSFLLQFSLYKKCISNNLSEMSNLFVSHFT